MTFPKELERQFFRDADFTFVMIWFLTFAILNSLVLYLQTLPVRELTEEDIQKFNQAIERFVRDHKSHQIHI